MEYAAAALTLILVWLLCYHAAQSGRRLLRARARKRAGDCLFVSLRPNARLWEGILIFASVLFILAEARFGIFLLDIVPFSLTQQLLQAYSLVSIAGTLALVAHLIPHMGMEVHERGFFYRAAGFMPWSQVKYCKWLRPGRLFVQCQDRNNERRVDPKDVEGLTRVLSRFVEVRDSSDDVIGGPETRGTGPAADVFAQKRERFQYSMRMLLVVVLLISMGASWAGIRVEKNRRQRAAVAALSGFHPAVRFMGMYVTSLDFSKSPVKPGDADLVHLRELYRLESLDLSGCNVSDAGLEQLRHLPRLRWLFLYNTRVTQAGADELNRRLPDAFIARNPPGAPASVQPVSGGGGK